MATPAALVSGIGVVPVPMDGDGIIPDLLGKAFGSTGARAVYLQPTHHNPTGIVMSPARRREVRRRPATRCGAMPNKSRLQLDEPLLLLGNCLHLAASRYSTRRY